MIVNELLTNGYIRIPALVHSATHGLEESLLSARPAGSANSIAWLAWHIARGQDAWVSELRGTTQEWVDGGWESRFGMAFDTDETGFEMPAAETAAVIAPASLLTGYLAAVTVRTLEYIWGLGENDLDEIVDATRHPAITRGVQLMSILDDGLQHAGQAGYARGILDSDNDTEKAGS